MNSPYLTVKEVANLLNVSCKWVYANKHHLPGYIKINGLIRFNRHTLIKGLEQLTLQPQKGYCKRFVNNRHNIL